jgi:putative transcriptional regulator
MPDVRFQKSCRSSVCKHDDDGRARHHRRTTRSTTCRSGQVFKQLGIEVPKRANLQPVLFGGPVEPRAGWCCTRPTTSARRRCWSGRHGAHRLARDPEGHGGGSGPKQAWLALGHSGWAPASSTARCRTMPGWWSTATALVFDSDLEAKWQRALDRLGGKGAGGRRFDPARYSHQTDAPDSEACTGT